MRLKAMAILAAVHLATGILSANAQEKIKIGLIADPAYEAAAWALANGKVSDPSISVTVEFLPVPAMIQAAMTKEFDILPNGVLAVPQLNEAGVPVRIMGTVQRYNELGHSTDIFVKNDSPAKTIRDMKGKRIAVSSFEAQNVISLRALMSEKYGMNPAVIGGDITWVELPLVQFEPALETGEVDGVAPGTSKAYAIAKTGRYRSIIRGPKELKELYGGPMTSILLTAYRPDLEKRPEAYVAAQKLMQQSVAYTRDHASEVFAAVAPKYKLQPNDLSEFFATYSTIPFTLGPTDKKVIEAAWRSGVALGALEKMPASVDDYVWPLSLVE